MKHKQLLFIVLLIISVCTFQYCSQPKNDQRVSNNPKVYTLPDTNTIPNDKFGAMVRYGLRLMQNTAYYIGPEGINGNYLRNKMNCTNCHQWAGTKPYSFSLMLSHEKYPQYRAREGKVLSLAERINNCVMRPHSGRPLPLDSDEMIAFLSYFKWINSTLTPEQKQLTGFDNLEINFPDSSGSTKRGELVYTEKCMRCHGTDGEGKMNDDNITYLYPPLWGAYAYQPGSSMHRVIKQARWLKANMPHDSATWDNPILTNQEAIDLASFINNDDIHQRPNPKTLDYPFANEKAIDYALPPFADTFSAKQHKYGPFKPIIKYWKVKGLKPSF
jgi:thiosulfate dehydrogenase